MKRRITAMLVVLAMLLGMMPGTARAEILTAAAGITEVGIPSGRILTYNSSMQTGVEEGSFYSIIGNTARNVGTYGAILSLNDKNSYVWSDGTTEDKTVVWKINKKNIVPTVELSKDSLIFNGKARKPNVIVRDGSNRLTASDYMASFYKNKNVGEAYVIINLRGNYAGKKQVTFRILPRGTSLRSLKKGFRAVTVRWNKQSRKMASSRITGYQILLATDKGFTKNKKTVSVKGYKRTSVKIKGLIRRKRYFVRIRTFKVYGNKRYYSPWSKIRTVKTR